MSKAGSLSRKRGSRGVPTIWKSSDKIKNTKASRDNSRYASELQLANEIKENSADYTQNDTRIQDQGGK
jgi:hypothetical protein